MEGRHPVAPRLTPCGGKRLKKGDCSSVVLLSAANSVLHQRPRATYVDRADQLRRCPLTSCADCLLLCLRYRQLGKARQNYWPQTANSGGRTRAALLLGYQRQVLHLNDNNVIRTCVFGTASRAWLFLTPVSRSAAMDIPRKVQPLPDSSLSMTYYHQTHFGGSRCTTCVGQMWAAYLCIGWEPVDCRKRKSPQPTQ